jgi:hypothetical protein
VRDAAEVRELGDRGTGRSGGEGAGDRGTGSGGGGEAAGDRGTGAGGGCEGADDLGVRDGCARRRSKLTRGYAGPRDKGGVYGVDAKGICKIKAPPQPNSLNCLDGHCS